MTDVGDQELVEVIQEVGMRHYSNDTDCPLNWEPSGSDFLSPCLQEADLMSRLMEDDLAFGSWLELASASGRVSLPPSANVESVLWSLRARGTDLASLHGMWAGGAFGWQLSAMVPNVSPRVDKDCWRRHVVHAPPQEAG